MAGSAAGSTRRSRRIPATKASTAARAASASPAVDSSFSPTEKGRTKIKLPDERHGVLFVFRVFNRMSYALILSVKDPVTAGDRFTQP